MYKDEEDGVGKGKSTFEFFILFQFERGVTSSACYTIVSKILLKNRNSEDQRKKEHTIIFFHVVPHFTFFFGM